jgi:alcohol dehydrogenase YqhD (iron-dependent ADH family)
MIPFDYQPRTRIVFGPGKIESLGALAGELGARRALVVSDPGIVAPDEEWTRCAPRASRPSCSTA